MVEDYRNPTFLTYKNDFLPGKNQKIELLLDKYLNDLLLYSYVGVRWV
jgi:hypothetical protein